MNRKILFSPVGGTDPISQKNYSEGALMQIARYWKPDIIYLYMSKEILENQAKDGGDGRYIYCLNKLGEKIGCKFEINIIFREKLEDVHLFNPIYEDFEKVLASIEEEMDETDELWLNMSSGTPAMKSSFLILATMLDYKCQCIQVDTPSKQMNEHVHERDWELMDFWDLDADNEPGAVNRTHSEELPLLKLLKYEENIKKFVEEYDYNAALKLTEDMKRERVLPYINKLRLAKARKDLDTSKVNELIKHEGKDKNIYLPYNNGDYRELYEYILELQTKVDRKEYADFLRALSPVFVNLFAAILKKNTGFALNEYSSIDSKGALKWDDNKLNGTEYKQILDNAYQFPFVSGYVQSDHLCKLVGELIVDNDIEECVSNLREIEKKARNIVSHNIIFVDDNWIREKTGYNSAGIVDKIQSACKYTEMNMSFCKWDSYKTMNEDISTAISKGKE